MSKIVERTLDFFELFAREKRALTLSEIARMLSIPPSSCHDVLMTLSRRGYIYEPRAGAGYYPTHRLRHIADSIATVDMTLIRAEEALRHLRDATGETVSLARVETDRIITLLSFPATFNFGIAPEVGTRVRSYHATAAGKAYLGSLSADARRAYLTGRELEQLTPHTVTDVDQIEAELEFCERRGWFMNREGSVEGVTALASRFTQGGTVYIVNMPGPSVRVLPKVDSLAQHLIQTCQLLQEA
ncbi:MAG: IclR family transcriptional regulator [Propionibacteriaceae bacterium]|nr:IclR family transcriptional regulator [Propionibacteriaceae bacterium]